MLTKKEIYNRLASFPGVYKQSDVQLRIRCFICGDSAKNENKKRLGIKIDIHDPDAPVVYNCFNCYAQGIFTASMVKEMGMDDPELEESIRALNKHALNDNGTKVNKYKNVKEIKVELPPLYNKPECINKVRYVFQRIGTQIDPIDFPSLRIVWSLKDFLYMNQISFESKKNIEFLDRDYVGFLSVHNEYIIFRDITEKNKMRWIKYNIFNVFDNTQGFYTMKGSLDLMDTDDIHIVITEGPFDLLSLRYNVFHNNISNKIMISSCNGSFLEPLLYYVRKGVVGGNVKIDCYQDNDTRLKFRDIREKLKPYILSNSNFTVYYNTMSKDFGVPKENIQIDIRRI